MTSSGHYEVDKFVRRVQPPPAARAAGPVFENRIRVEPQNAILGYLVQRPFIASQVIVPDLFDRCAKRVAIRGGASPHESPLFYRDIGLALIFLPAALLTMLLLAALKFNALFLVCASVVGLSLYYATKRRVLLAVLFGMLAVRFALGSVFVQNFSMFVAGLGFGATALALGFSNRTAYPDGGTDKVTDPSQMM